MTRSEILAEAERIVTGDREEQYGPPEDNFALIAELWALYLRRMCVSSGADVYIKPDDVAIMMVLLKIARTVTVDKPKADSYIDMAGYASCAGEIACSSK